MKPEFAHRLSILKDDFQMISESLKLLKRLEELEDLDMSKGEGIETLHLVRVMTKNVLRDLDSLLPPKINS